VLRLSSPSPFSVPINPNPFFDTEVNLLLLRFLGRNLLLTRDCLVNLIQHLPVLVVQSRNLLDYQGPKWTFSALDTNTEYEGGYTAIPNPKGYLRLYASSNSIRFFSQTSVWRRLRQARTSSWESDYRMRGLCTVIDADAPITLVGGFDR
jgi:hypothetical protein